MFSKDDFTRIPELCNSFARELEDGHKSITMLDLGEKVDQKTGLVTCCWKQLIGEAYEKMMIANKEKNKLVALEFCQRALKYYKQVKNTNKIDELEGVYNKLKGEIEFPQFKIELNLQEYIEDCEKQAKAISQLPAFDIIRFLMVERKLLPTYRQMEKAADVLIKSSLKSVVPIQIFDAKGHTVEHFNTEEEIKYFYLLRQYKWYLETNFLPLISIIILQTVKENKLTFSFLMDFFKNYSWFGKTLTRKSQNKEISYNWLNLLAPSVFEFFSQTEYSLSSGNNPNLVLCIDSLVLKIEGLLRDLCNYSGITTFAQKRYAKGRIIYNEKDLNALLHDKRMVNLFDEDNLLFFKFVLVEKAGYNLRHKVAHSLIGYEEYQVGFSHLLLLLLLKLGKFDFPAISETGKVEEKESKP